MLLPSKLRCSSIMHEHPAGGVLETGILFSLSLFLFQLTPMLRTFNSFQTVAAFVAMPFLISWLSNADFRGASVAFYSACALYIVAFGFMVAAVSISFDKYN